MGIVNHGFDVFILELDIWDRVSLIESKLFCGG